MGIEFLAELKEADSDGKWNIKVIQPGWGSSGYYSNEVLESAASKFEGVHMYWNHPSMQEEYDRPERDLRDLAGVLTNVAWDADNPNGAGIYGKATVFGSYAEALKEIAPFIGVSIRAGGQVTEGEAEGKHGTIIESIDVAESVDFVTRAGAGGKVLTQFAEAAKPGSYQDKEADMELDEALRKLGDKEAEADLLRESLDKAEAKLDGMQKEVTRMKEAQAFAECRQIISKKLAEAELPDIVKARIESGTLELSIVTEDEDGEPEADEQATEEAVEEAIKRESDYLAKITGGVKVIGMGSVSESEKDVSGALEEAFRGMGMSERAAKIAANGR